eukprot:6180749-Pleurochrysis_carterae.AAC.2
MLVLRHLCLQDFTSTIFVSLDHLGRTLPTRSEGAFVLISLEVNMSTCTLDAKLTIYEFIDPFHDFSHRHPRVKRALGHVQLELDIFIYVAESEYLWINVDALQKCPGS